MAAIVGVLEFNHDEICVGVDAQQVNPPGAVEPVSELFGDYHEALVNHVDLHAQEPLDILASIFGIEGGLRRRLQSCRRDLKDGHLPDFLFEGDAAGCRNDGAFWREVTAHPLGVCHGFDLNWMLAFVPRAQ